jgi:hypothetical protein
MTKIQILKNSLFWGFVLWLIGWVLGVVLFMTPLRPVMGWVIMPVGTLITLLVLIKKINREKYVCYFGVGVIWTVMAVVLDYLFIILLFDAGLAYYKLDVCVYYILTFVLPLIVGVFKTKKQNESV